MCHRHKEMELGPGRRHSRQIRFGATFNEEKKHLQAGDGRTRKTLQKVKQRTKRRKLQNTRSRRHKVTQETETQVTDKEGKTQT